MEELNEWQQLLKMLVRAQSKISIAIMGLENLIDFEEDITPEDKAEEYQQIKSLVKSCKKAIEEVKF